MVKRKKASLKVKLNIDPSLRGRFNIIIERIDAKALDISVSGIGLLSQLFLPQGVIVDLQLNINNKIVKTKGEIKSAISDERNLTRLGIKFIDLTKLNSKVIENFIKKNEKRFPARLKLFRRN